jgi:hypothetical protein
MLGYASGISPCSWSIYDGPLPLSSILYSKSVFHSYPTFQCYITYADFKRHIETTEVSVTSCVLPGYVVSLSDAFGVQLGHTGDRRKTADTQEELKELWYPGRN